jgi:hypothetical protein
VQTATLLALGVAATLTAACGGGTAYPAPAEPEAAVRGFLDGVRANSLVAMSELWGTERGPAASYMTSEDDRRQMQQRLTVMQAYLVHDRWEFVTGNESVGARADERILQVRLYRNNCSPVVPFTVVRYRTGWLVQQVDLEAAGNPRRTCTT